jgi:hypothetical protein
VKCWRWLPPDGLTAELAVCDATIEAAGAELAAMAALGPADMTGLLAKVNGGAVEFAPEAGA